MRSLATVGLKLIGVLGIYWTAQFLPLLIMWGSSLFSARGYPQEGTVSFNTWIWVLMIIISASYSVTLLVRTPWVIKALRFPEESHSSSIEPFQLLRIGFVLLGAYCLMEAIPALGTAIYTMNNGFLPNMANHATNFDLTRIIAPALKFLLGCILLGKAERFANSVFKTLPPEPPA